MSRIAEFLVIGITIFKTVVTGFWVVVQHLERIETWLLIGTEALALMPRFRANGYIHGLLLILRQKKKSRQDREDKK